MNALAALVVGPDERIESIATLPAYGMGSTVVEVVTTSADASYSYIVSPSGEIETTQGFWSHERNDRLARFGRMTPLLFESQSALESNDTITVDVMVWTDLPEPEIPYDSTPELPIEAFKTWTKDHARAQVLRISTAKQRVRSFLDSVGAEILEDPAGLPTIRTILTASVLRSQELNAADIVRIDPVTTEPAHLLGDHAGHAAMNVGALTGGFCGPACDGGSIDVGLWEKDSSAVVRSGLARNNSRLSSTNIPTGYFDCPTVCNSDADCPSPSDVELHCRDVTNVALFHDHLGNSCANTPSKVCVQDHLTWVAASVGMVGNYNYSTTVPLGVPDPIPNVPSNQNLPSGGAWAVDFRIGNDPGQNGLDYLIAPPDGAPPAVYVNRSQDQTPDVTNFPGRAFGTFVTASSGNSEVGPVTCAHLKNGLCVGMYDYQTFNDLSTHRRTHLSGGIGSSFLNDGAFDSTLERPHVLGPGNHQGNNSGEHMPNVNVTSGSEMRFGFFAGGTTFTPILGTSFSAPAVLSAAIMAQQYKGWLSLLAYPMVNKAVLMASTQDANADGAVGKSNTWSSQPADAEDGAGQINLAFVKTTLDNNRFIEADLADSNFASCGFHCRSYIAASISIPAMTTARVALAWQACMTAEGSTPTLNNDLDLALNCGSPLITCGGTTLSSAVSSELELLERPGCTYTKSCTIEVRIKNGAVLNSCGSTTTERIGVAWALH